MIAIQLVKFSEHIIVAIINNIRKRMVHRDGSHPNGKSPFGGYICPSFSKDAIKLDICSSNDKSISWTVLPTCISRCFHPLRIMMQDTLEALVKGEARRGNASKECRTQEILIH